MEGNEAEALHARVAELESSASGGPEVDSASGGEAALSEATGSASSASGGSGGLEARAAAAERALAEALERELAALRRALLAEHRGQVVEELVAGDSAEALEASVEAARSAHARILEQARQQLQASVVPAGAGARTGDDLAGLSPTEKIARGLRG